MANNDMSRPLSRRALLSWAGRFGVTVATAAALPLSVARAAVQNQKLSKKDAMYQDQPKGNQQCSGCVQFQAPDQCKLVSGNISPKGWCAFFAPKQSG